MFISFNQFVFLILLTIVMIALIVFLTFTGTPSRRKKLQNPAENRPFQQENTHPLVQPTPEPDVAEVPFLRNQQPEIDSSQLSKPTYGGSDFYYLSREHPSQKFNTVEEKTPFSILPYPKETPPSDKLNETNEKEPL